MLKPKLLLKIAGGVVILVLFAMFRISNIDFRCAPQATGLSYCRLHNAPPRLLEGIAALIPESAQVQVGGKLAVLLPNVITPAESTHAVDLATQIYTKMSQDKKWAFVHSSLGMTYERILHLQVPPDQYYVYIPPHAAGEQLPVLLFLHGFGGNFTSYFYLLAQAADAAKFAIVAPTYGEGEWDAQSVPFVQDVLREAGAKFPIDTSRITLMGISNGGLIMANMIPALGNSLRNVVFLSTYMELGQYTQPQVLSVLRNVNTVKVIYGDRDSHIDAAEIPVKVQKLAEQGVNALYSKIPGEDHFLFFSQPQPVLNDLLTLQY